MVRLGELKTAFAVASSGYCLVHVMLTHRFSVQVFLGAFAFGTAATIAIAWVTDRFRSNR
jgi:hypothetical protein